MGVDIQRQPNTAMPKEFADHFGMDPLLQEQGSGRMAQVVKTDMREPGFIEQWPKGAAEKIPRFHRLPDLVRKDEIVIFPHWPELEPYGGLPAAMVA